MIKPPSTLWKPVFWMKGTINFMIQMMDVVVLVKNNSYLIVFMNLASMIT